MSCMLFYVPPLPHFIYKPSCILVEYLKFALDHCAGKIPLYTLASLLILGASYTPPSYGHTPSLPPYFLCRPSFHSRQILCYSSSIPLREVYLLRVMHYHRHILAPPLTPPPVFSLFALSLYVLNLCVTSSFFHRGGIRFTPLSFSPLRYPLSPPPLPSFLYKPLRYTCENSCSRIPSRFTLHAFSPLKLSTPHTRIHPTITAAVSFSL